MASSIVAVDARQPSSPGRAVLAGYCTRKHIPETHCQPSVLHTLPPLDAYREDLAHARVERLTDADPLWLQLALILQRLSQLPMGTRTEFLLAASGVLRANTSMAQSRRPTSSEPADPAVGIGAEEGATQALEAVADALQLSAVGELLDDDGPSAAGPGREIAADALLTPVQQVAGTMELAGAFRLAFTLLATAGLVVPGLSASLRARMLAQRGRIARQAGDAATALVLYTDAERLARRSGNDDVRFRALMGRGAVASTRGNYPEARMVLGKALRLARRIGNRLHIASAHQGLLMAAVAAGDVDTALCHGWAALEHAGEAVEARAEALGALGGVSLRAGHPQAALRSYETVLQSTRLPRQRLAALGGAVLAAGRLRDERLVARLAESVVQEVDRSPHVYENAFALLELAEAQYEVGHVTAAAQYIGRARDLARANQYYEVMHRADALELALSLDAGRPGQHTRTAASSSHRRSGLRQQECAAQRQDGAGGEATRTSGRARAVLQALERLPANVGAQ